MREHFLFFLWRYQLYEKGGLRTTDGRRLTIVHPGHLNHNAGPDFLNGVILLEGIRWYGHIEIHVLGRNWKSHGHEKDPAFHNVILHVVYDQKQNIIDQDGHPLPTLMLKHRIPLHLIRNQDALYASKSWVPCSGQLHSVRDITTTTAIHRMAINRLDDKARLWLNRLEELKGDWIQLGYEVFLRAMGFKVNGEAFELLARCTPFRILAKNIHDPFRVEALLFGQAQLLRKDDPYSCRLKKEYAFLKLKYALAPMKPGVCRFLRTRPSNFPDRRLSQAIGILTSSSNPLGLLLENLDREVIKAILSTPASDYFNVLNPLSKRGASLGKNSILSIMINMVVPLHFALAEKRKNEDYKEAVAVFLSDLPPECNHVIGKWSKEGLIAKSALETQGLLELYLKGCQKKKCLVCPIGMEIMRQKDSARSIS